MEKFDPEDDLQASAPSLQPPLLNQNGFDFGHMTQGSCKTLQEVIANPNTQPMIWLADTGESQWLTLEPDRGVLQPGEQQSIRVTAATSSLTVGEHTVTLTFSSEGDETSMSSTKLSKVDVLPELAPISLQIGLDFGSLLPHSSRTLGLIVKNSDRQLVNWNASIGAGLMQPAEHAEKRARRRKRTVGGKEIDLISMQGLTLSEVSGSLAPDEAHTIYVTANTENLDPGFIYSTVVGFHPGNLGTPPSVEIPVTLYVDNQPFFDGGPKLPSNPLSVTFGPGLTPQTGGSYTWTITNPPPNGPVHWYAIAPKVSWLTLTPTPPTVANPGTLNPSQSTTITLHTNTANLKSGETYTDDLVLSFTKIPPNNDGHDTSSMTIPVNMIVP